jgi:hypothetical protein
MKNRVISWLLVGAFSVMAFVVAPVAAVASPEGRKNTALLLGGAAVYSLVKKKTTQGLVLGAAGVYAYKRYKDSKEQRKVRQAYASGVRAASYRTVYRNGRAYRTRIARR